MIYLLIISFFGGISSIFFIHFKINTTLKENHNIKIKFLKKQIHIHKSQIQKREKGLQNYDFLKYNLKESLLVQPEINLF